MADSFANRLNQLFETQRDPDGKPWTNVAVAKAMHGIGFPGAPGYLSQLRNGQRDNPTLAYVKAVAEVFGVPAAYFTEDAAEAARLRDDHAVLAALQDSGIAGLALRAKDLDRESLQSIEVIMDAVRKLKGYPEIP